jgi:polyhydroxybutyrate depolymerase
MSSSSTLVRWTGGWCASLLVVAALGCGSSTGATGSGGAGGSAATSGGAGKSGTGGVAGAPASTGAGGSGTGGDAVAGTGGVTGAAGSKGVAGATGGGGGKGPGGTSGTSGVGGTTGLAGTTGAAGTKGAGGANGTAGAKGTAGSGGGGPVPSSGCSATSSPASGMATIDVGGTTRQYILTLPAGYDPRHAYPLLFAFHGGSYNAQWVVDGTAPQSGPYYGIQAVANNTAILVAPQALSGSWTNQSGRDVAYVDAMISRFESQLCVDQSRILATGFSFGAIMTIALGCNDSSKFRAIAAMSGEIMNGCPDTRSLPYWSSHGMSDPTINFSLGQAARDTFVQRNHCSTQTVAVSPPGCVSYQGCDAGFPVVWCPFDGVHEPPPFAGTAIWAFLSQF